VGLCIFCALFGNADLKVKPHIPGGAPQELFDSAFYNTFRRTVNWCVKHRWLTIGATVLIFVLGIVGMGKVQQQFFPDSSRPEIMMDIWLPEGTSVAANEAFSLQVEKRLFKLEGVGRSVLGGFRRAAFLPAPGPSLSAKQCVAVHHPSQRLETA
jgi:multidrug efflux pump